MPSGVYDRSKSKSRPTKPIEERFWSKVDKNGSPWKDTPCWLWTAWHRPDGYANFKVAGKMVLAHRFAYELMIGPIPVGLTLDHLCRNPSCVNPDHLEPVTNRENNLRGVGACAQHARATHCSQGHPYNLFNTMIEPKGSRHCRQCLRMFGTMRQRKWRRLHPASHNKTEGGKQ